jgi:hypothetical protein
MGQALGWIMKIMNVEEREHRRITLRSINITQIGHEKNKCLEQLPDLNRK